MKNTILLIVIVILTALLAACSGPATATPISIIELTDDQAPAFYAGQIVFYAVNPQPSDGSEFPWYTEDEAAELIVEAKERKDHNKIGELPFILENVKDISSTAFYYGYASACVSAPDSFATRSSKNKRFSAVICADLTTQAIELK